MKWAAAVSTQEDIRQAIDEVVARIREDLNGAPPDLLIVFASSEHLWAASELPHRLSTQFPEALVVGCSSAGVIGGGHELEKGPCLSVTAASLPEVTLRPFHLETVEMPPPDAPVEAWHHAIGVPATPTPHILLLGDPFTCDAEALIQGLDRAYPGSKKVGGLASGGKGAGSLRLFLGQNTWRSGAVGVALSGDISVDTLVAQGCRPIGRPMLVTQVKGNLLLSVDGRPPLEVLRELFHEVSPEDQELFGQSIFVGVEMREDRIEHKEGELLARNVVGLDPAQGAVAVGGRIRQFQVIQFLLRDARAAEQELRKLLKRTHDSVRGVRPAGALLFQCLGRGSALFGRSDHDTSLFREEIGPVPLGGFFCDGEIGPVGGTTFLHGYTSSFALFATKGSSR